MRIIATSAVALILSLAIFLAAGIAGSTHNPAWNRSVVLNGKTIGRVQLRPLDQEMSGRWSLNVYFEPAGGDLRILRDNKLHWWQVVDRENLPGYPRIDMQRGNTLPGIPGDDDDPAYYTREEKLGQGGFFSPEEIFADNKYWMRDTPRPENGAHFETWLVSQNDHEVSLLIGFEWELLANEGEVWHISQPRFVSVSRYNLEGILESSGFGEHWRVERVLH